MMRMILLRLMIMGAKSKIYEIAAIILMLAASLSGCSRVQYVPMQTVLKDSIVFHRIDIDSVVIKDSIFVDRTKDTVYKYVERWQEKYIIRNDTTVIERVDSIPVEVKVEKQLTRWQQIKIDYGDNVLVMLVAVIVVTCVQKFLT